MNRCRACRRPLTNPASVKHQLGPECLKRAVKAGTAPLVALEELREWERTKPRQKRQQARQKRQEASDDQTADLFAPLRQAAIDRLQAAVAECQALGVAVTIQFQEHERM